MVVQLNLYEVAAAIGQGRYAARAALFAALNTRVIYYYCYCYEGVVKG